MKHTILKTLGLAAVVAALGVGSMAGAETVNIGGRRLTQRAVDFRLVGRF